MGMYTYVLLHMQRSCLTNHIPNFTESERMARKLEEIHARYDRAVLETKSLAEDKERFEIEARKYRNQLDHARLSLDNTYESETRLRQELEFSKKDLAKFQDKFEQAEAELRRVTREKETLANENLSNAKLRDNDVDKLELEITQLNTERDQLVRQLEKSQDMLLSFQQDLNMTENELKRVSNENKRLRDEAGATEKGMMESKEREIKHLNDKVRAMEREYDDLIQKESRERIKADKAEREIANMKNQIDKLEIQREASIVANKDKNNFDSSKFDVEIARLTKERDLARTELEVCRHDLDKLEADFKTLKTDNDRLKTEQSSMTNGLEKGSKEILEAKENEIKKLTERVKTLETEVQTLKTEKIALEKQRDELEKALKDGGKVDNIDVANKEKKIIELTEQIKTYKAELSDKQKEFQQEKLELKKVIEEQRDQLKNGTTDTGDGSKSTTSNAEVEAMNKELVKAKQEIQEAAIEKERFQSQLEMLVQELEQKQIDLHEANQRLAKGGQGPASPGTPSFGQEIVSLKKSIEDKNKALAEVKAKLEEKEKELENAGGNTSDLMKRLNEAETKAKQAEGETERLLTLVSSTQEEQDIKDKLIKELQEFREVFLSDLERSESHETLV